MRRTSRIAVVIGGVAFLGLTVVPSALDAASPRLSPKKAATVQPALEEDVATGQLVLQEESVPGQSSIKVGRITQSVPVTYFDPFQLTRKSVAVSEQPAEVKPSAAAAPVVPAAAPVTVAVPVVPILATTVAAPVTAVARTPVAVVAPVPAPATPMTAETAKAPPVAPSVAFVATETTPAAPVAAAAPAVTVLATAGLPPREPIRPASRSPYVPLHR